MKLNLLKKLPKLIDMERCVVVKTRDYDLFIEKLTPTLADKGTYKFIAESNGNVEAINHEKEIFPRFYFLGESLSNEIFGWLMSRKQYEIISIELDSKIPKDIAEQTLNIYLGEHYE